LSSSSRVADKDYEPPADLDIFLRNKKTPAPTVDPTTIPASVRTTAKNVHDSSLFLSSDGTGADKQSSVSVVTENLGEDIAQLNKKLLESGRTVKADKALNDVFAELETRRSTDAYEIDLECRVLAERNEWDKQLGRYLQKLDKEYEERVAGIVRTQRKLFDIESAQRVEDSLQAERSKHLAEFERVFAKVQGIEKALGGRIAQDFENRRAKLYWASCQQIVDAIVHGNRAAETMEKRRKPLVELDFVDTFVGSEDAFVHTLVSQFPEEARREGVYTEEDLKRRFSKAYPLARRLAAVNTDGVGLVTPFRILLSYLQQIFTMDLGGGASIALPDDLETLAKDPYDVLGRLRRFVADGDLEKALRLSVLLRGEPARILSDWVRDTQRHREARLLADFIVLHASSTAIRTAAAN